MPVLFLLNVISHNALNRYGAVLSNLHPGADLRVSLDSNRQKPRGDLHPRTRRLRNAVVLASKDFIGHFVEMVLAYAVGIAVQIAFMNTPLCVGPISEHLNGADLSWVVTSPLYFWLAGRDSAYKRRMDRGKSVGRV